MGQYNQAVLTTAGQALLTSILGNAGTLTFSKFQTSSYQYASGTDLSALASLQSVEQNVVPSAGGIKDATTFYSSSTVPNTGVTVEYTNYTVGLFATDGDDQVLFAVSTAIVPDIIPVDDGGAPSTYTYTMSIGVSSTDNITVEVDDQGILRVSSIVDNLNSTSATQPLSANMGHLLNDKVKYYGVCSTAATTAAKTVSTANNDFVLETGAKIVVKFTNGNTAASPTLNVDSTGAIAIYQNGAAISEELLAGGSYTFVYNGTQFDFVGGSGHIVLDESGNAITQRQQIQFLGDSNIQSVDVEDENGITKVKIPKVPSIVNNLRSSSYLSTLAANQGKHLASDLAPYNLNSNNNNTGEVLTTGTYFINIGGQLCRVTSDIANNGAITLNTNCEAVSVGAELTELNSNKAQIKFDSVTGTTSGIGYFDSNVPSTRKVIFATGIGGWFVAPTIISNFWRFLIYESNDQGTINTYKNGSITVNYYYYE